MSQRIKYQEHLYGLIIKAFHRSRIIELDNHASNIALASALDFSLLLSNFRVENAGTIKVRIRGKQSSNQCTMITLNLVNSSVGAYFGS